MYHKPWNLIWSILLGLSIGISRCEPVWRWAYSQCATRQCGNSTFCPPHYQRKLSTHYLHYTGQHEVIASSPTPTSTHFHETRRPRRPNSFINSPSVNAGSFHFRLAHSLISFLVIHSASFTLIHSHSLPNSPPAVHSLGLMITAAASHELTGAATRPVTRSSEQKSISFSAHRATLKNTHIM